MTEPGHEPDQRLPAPRPPSEAAPADRLSAPRQAHRSELTPERAAQIVRQSASARWVGFLAVAVVVLFVIVYYFYELGAPLGLTTPRLAQQDDAQQVTSIERGYNLYQANCARCHGPDGQGTTGGYIAPVLNDQMKLYGGSAAHLSPSYIRNVLTVGGRYVCGNAKSIMPIWSNTNGGPLNYEQIEEIIAFLRAPSDQTFAVKDPSLNEPVPGTDGKPRTFTGWVDPSFKPDPAATPVPACYLDTGGGGTPAPSESLPPNAVTLEVTAEGIAYDTHALEAPANTPFVIHFTNKDQGIPHDVDIRLADGTVVQDNPTVNTAGEASYTIKALAPGTYTFICSVHPIPAMTGTLTVK
jgi:mono/diheme cytochrome c family protein/plastocyanin